MDPILSAIVGTATKSITSIAIQSSIPAWQRATEAAVFETRKVKSLAEWAEIRQSRRDAKRVERFLRSRQTVGTLEAYAIAYATQLIEPSDSRHFATFAEGFARALKVDRSVSDEMATLIWERTTMTIQLAIDRLRKSRALSAENQILFAKLTHESGDNKSALNTNLGRRLGVSLSDHRSARVMEAVSRIRSSSSKHFSEMLMPHARQGYRINSDALYISRRLAELSIDWQQSGDAFSPKETGERIPETAVLEKRFVVVGNPGAGKSTLVRRLLYGITRDESSELAPLLLELKAWTEDGGSLTGIIASRLASTIQEGVPEETLDDLFTLGLGFVAFDGIDEVVEIANRRALVRAIEAFVYKYPLCHVVVSSRIEGFSAVRLDPILFPAFRIPEFGDDEMESYVTKWFDVVEKQDDVEATALRDGFLLESVHAAELRRNPLMLSLLCLLYQSEGYIPENRLRVYEECAELLFSRWDRVRRVDTLLRREVKRHHLVEEIAHRIFTLRLGRGAGERETALKAFVTEYFLQNLTEDRFEARDEADRFLEHCTGRAWLLTHVGLSPKGDRVFDFTHRTFMEYFTACRIARFAGSPASLVSEIRPMLSQGSGTVIAQLAILRFDERVVDGGDTVVRLLVFDSPTLEQRYSATALRFVAGAAKALQLKPRTETSVLKAVLREYSKAEVGVDIGAVVSMPTAARASIERLANALLRETAERSWDEEATEGARLLLRQTEQRDRDPRWLFRYARETLVIRLVDGDVKLPRYRSIAGSGCFVDVGLQFEGFRRTVGPLARGLRSMAVSGFMPPVLDEMFRMLVRDPLCVFPMSRAAVVELTEAIEDLDDWTLESVLGARRPVERQPIAGFTNLCAVVAMRAFDNGLKECTEAALTSGIGLDFRLDVDTPRELVASAIRQAPSVLLNGLWLSRIDEWSDGQPAHFSDAAADL